MHRACHGMFRKRSGELSGRGVQVDGLEENGVLQCLKDTAECCLRVSLPIFPAGKGGERISACPSPGRGPAARQGSSASEPRSWEERSAKLGGISSDSEELKGNIHVLLEHWPLLGVPKSRNPDCRFSL